MVVKILLYLINIDKNGTEISIPFPPLKAMPGQSPGDRGQKTRLRAIIYRCKTPRGRFLNHPIHTCARGICFAYSYSWYRVMSRFGHQLGLHKPAALFHPKVCLLAVDHADIPIPHAAHLGGAAADILDLVDLVHLLRGQSGSPAAACGRPAQSGHPLPHTAFPGQ